MRQSFPHLATLLARSFPQQTTSTIQTLLPLALFHSSPTTCSEATATVQATPPPTFILSSSTPTDDDPDSASGLTPSQIVTSLDKHIVGQADAKRAVAIAMRNRWRRHKIGGKMKEEVLPKNILLIGPTGVGKTEVARRMAKLADAPFVKVEATKFTEVGFHGRDVDTIIKDLIDNSIQLQKNKIKKQMSYKIQQIIEDKILDAMCGAEAEEDARAPFRKLYRQGLVEDQLINIEVPINNNSRYSFDSAPGMPSMQDFVIRLEGGRGMSSKRTERKTVKIKDAKQIIEDSEIDKYDNQDTLIRDAIKAVEQDGIVFLDEIDKIVINKEHTRYGADASSEGVQRDLLPLIEGCNISTKYGNVSTDHILFVCSGAFHNCKVSDMLAELQGRLPVRVELKGLKCEEFYRILTEPEGNLVKQQQALLLTEGVNLTFTEQAIYEIAKTAEYVNEQIDNIGARRLHTIIEKICEAISYDAPEMVKEARAVHGPDHVVNIMIDFGDVQDKVQQLMKKQDLYKYIL